MSKLFVQVERVEDLIGRADNYFEGGQVITYDKLMDSILTAQEQMLQYNIEANSVTLNGRKYGKLIENLPPNMKPTIFGMAVKADYALPDAYDFLVQYEPLQPKTNADRIRSMTDEELAEFLTTVAQNSANKLCESLKTVDVDLSNCDFGILYKTHLDWLKQEVKER